MKNFVNVYPDKSSVPPARSILCGAACRIQGKLLYHRPLKTVCYKQGIYIYKNPYLPPGIFIQTNYNK